MTRIKSTIHHTPALKSVELKFTSENNNCNKCFKFKLLSTHVYLTFLAFYILYCVLLGVNLSEKPLWTTFSTRHVRIHLFTVKKGKNWMILSGVAWKVNCDKLLFYIHNKTSYPWLVNDRYKMWYGMPTYCYNSKTSKYCGLHKEHALDNLNDVLQVYVAILPIRNNTYKLRNIV